MSPYCLVDASLKWIAYTSVKVDSPFVVQMSEQLVLPEYRQDGPEARRIASVIPYYPFHGIERFYDISGMLSDPEGELALCYVVSITSQHSSSALTSW